jgi:uncharacterized protein (TIGR02996 family)
MRDDELGLLAQIRANPHDKQVRRVYGDLLIERGDERGEYTQIALQETWGDAKERYDELSRREAAWAVELGLGTMFCQWYRGLPSTIVADVDAFVNHADALARLPIANVTLQQPRRATVEQFCGALIAVSSPAFERLALLSLSLGADARHVFESGALAPLRYLHVRDDLRDSIASLGRAEHVRDLRTLELPQCRIDDAGITTLASSQQFASLESLYLQGNELGREGAIALANATGMPQLKKLYLVDNPFRSGGQHYTEFSEHSDGVSGWYDNRFSHQEIRAWFAHRPGLQVDL